jgi:hypothetical protein
VAGIGRLQHDDRNKIRGQLLHGYTLPDDFRRQLRFRELFTVLGLDLGDVRVGADLKRQLDGHMPIVTAGGIEIEQVVDAGERDLDRPGDRFRCDFRAGTGIIRIDLNDRWGNLWKLGDRQELQRE